MIGTGYVGLTTGVALAYVGHEVVGVDKDPEKLRLLQHGRSPIHEYGLQELLAQTRARLRFTDQAAPAVADAEVIMIAVGTPPKESGEADTQFVEEAAREVAEAMQDGRAYTVVVKSTVPIGTNRRVANVIHRVLRDRGNAAEVLIASNPEFLREGQALRDFLYPDRIVVGAEEAEAVDVLRRLYRPILEQTFDPPPALPRPTNYNLPPLITTDPVSAEMIKYAANAFLALKISFINEIAGLCEKLGVDVTEVARGIGLDPRIGPLFLQAGLGWGGSCFPKDTAALLPVGQAFPYQIRLVEVGWQANFRHQVQAVEGVRPTLAPLSVIARPLTRRRCKIAKVLYGAGRR